MSKNFMLPTSIILRGISGVGKTVLRKILKTCLCALDKKVKVISKDEYRRLHHPWTYSDLEEKEVSDWYQQEYSASLHQGYDFIISDTTFCNRREFRVPFNLTNVLHTGRIMVINIGDGDSPSNSQIGAEILLKMRQFMKESQPALDDLERHGTVQQYYIDPRSAIEEGITDIVREIVN